MKTKSPFAITKGLFDEIIKEPFEWDNGDLIVPDRPGIGTNLDEDKLENFRCKLSDLRK